MRALLHVASILLALPGIALAGLFLILGHAIATHSLPGFFGELLAAALWLIPWGIITIAVVLLALVLGGLSSRLRPIAAASVALVTIASNAVLLFMLTRNDADPEQFTFFAPAVIATGLSVWLALTEPRRESLAAWTAR